MSDKTPRPDRADHNDPDIPTYDANDPAQGNRPSAGSTPGSTRASDLAANPTPQPEPTPSTESAPTSSIYERTGRAAPQDIPAGGTTENNPAANTDGGTTAFPAQGGSASTAAGTTGTAGAAGSTGANYAAPADTNRTQPAPSTYRDEDFARTNSAQAAPSQAAPQYTEQTYANPNAGTAAPAAAAPAAAAPAASQPAAATTGTVDADNEVVVDKKAGRRGTIDFGLLIARLLLGVWLVLESIGTFFQLGGSEGIAGLESAYEGYPFAEILSIAVPTMQLAAGVFLIVGLVTPVAAAVATVATGFVALHELASSGTGLNVFAWPETVWLSLVLFGLSMALQFTGPGYYSLDNGRSWTRRPLASSWIFIVIALVALGALWWFGTAINPFA